MGRLWLLGFLVVLLSISAAAGCDDIQTSLLSLAESKECYSSLKVELSEAGCVSDCFEEYDELKAVFDTGVSKLLFKPTGSPATMTFSNIDCSSGKPSSLTFEFDDSCSISLGLKSEFEAVEVLLPSIIVDIQDMPPTIDVGKEYSLTVAVKNVGSGDAEDVSGSVIVPVNLVSVDDDRFSIDIVRAGEVKYVHVPFVFDDYRERVPLIVSVNSYSLSDGSLVRDGVTDSVTVAFDAVETEKVSFFSFLFPKKLEAGEDVVVDEPVEVVEESYFVDEPEEFVEEDIPVEVVEEEVVDEIPDEIAVQEIPDVEEDVVEEAPAESSDETFFKLWHLIGMAIVAGLVFLFVKEDSF